MTSLHKELYEALREAGASEDKAKAAASSLMPGAQVASKLDLAKLESRLLWGLGGGGLVALGIATGIILNRLPPPG